MIQVVESPELLCPDGRNRETNSKTVIRSLFYWAGSIVEMVRFEPIDSLRINDLILFRSALIRRNHSSS